MAEWDFPEKLPCFDPKGTPFEQVFNDPIALIAYAQYRRRHLVSAEMNTFLQRFPLKFAEDIRKKISHNKAQLGFETITVDEVVELWWWRWSHYAPSVAKDERSKQKWRVMLEPLMPFFRGEKTVLFKRVLPSGECHLEVEEVKTNGA